MRPPGMLAISLALGTMACSTPFPCPRWCWSHQQDVPDITDENMTGVPDGRFDAPCFDFQNLTQWYPPLPPFGWYAAEQCLAADVHQIIAETVASIQDPTIDASQACDVTDLQVYADLVQALALQARDACVAHLTCNGVPAGCDIDPMTVLDQACTVPSAETLCDQVVLTPALAALSDLSNGPGAAQPARDGTILQYIDDPHDCQPLLQGDTDDTPVCPDPGDDSVDDSTGTTGEGAAPFGDIDTLVTCTAPTRCTVEPELFANVQDNFGVFYDDGVWLEPVDIPKLGRGVQLSGLERGEASYDLFAALGIADGDVLTHIDGASLGSPATLEHLLLDLPTTTTWSLTIRRATGSTWLTLDYSITRAP
jgi:hypothetical protein